MQRRLRERSIVLKDVSDRLWSCACHAGRPVAHTLEQVLAAEYQPIELEGMNAYFVSLGISCPPMHVHPPSREHESARFSKWRLCVCCGEMLPMEAALGIHLVTGKQGVRDSFAWRPMLACWECVGDGMPTDPRFHFPWVVTVEAMMNCISVALGTLDCRHCQWCMCPLPEPDVKQLCEECEEVQGTLADRGISEFNSSVTPLSTDVFILQAAAVFREADIRPRRLLLGDENMDELPGLWTPESFIKCATRTPAMGSPPRAH